MVKVTAAIILLASASAVLLAPAEAATFTDSDVLQFALNLECLEAEFYSWVAYGKGLYSVNSSLVGTTSNLTAASSGGKAPTDFSGETIAYATEVAENEIDHVAFLRSALGSKALACPSLSLSPETFTAAARAAVSASGLTLASSTATDAFNPYLHEEHFWLAAFIFEDVGVTAYNGAVSVLADASLAATASGIAAVEAMHAALVRYAVYEEKDDPTGLTTSDGTAISYGSAAGAIAKLRDILGGTSSASVENPITRTAAAPAVNTANQPDLFAVNSAAVSFVRSPYQVLDIVYFSNTTTPGGFFPHGVTGNSALASKDSTPAKSRCAKSS